VGSGLFGRLIDVYSERTTMFVLHLGSGVALVLAALAQSYLLLVAAVVTSGCLQSLSNPVTNRLVSAYAPRRRRGILMGVKQAGVQMAQFSAGLAMPSLALLVGWRGGLGVATGLAVLGLLLTWRHIPRARKAGRRGSVTRRGGTVPRAVWWLTAY